MTISDLLAPRLHALHRDLITSSGGRKARDELRGLLHEAGHAFANLRQNVRELRKDKKALIVAVDEQIRRDGAMEDHGGGHLPVAGDLTEVGVVGIGGGGGEGEEGFGRLPPKLSTA